MIPYDLDPSLYSGEPEPVMLDDGFSPPHHDAMPSPAPERPAEGDRHEVATLGTQSLF